MFLAEGRSRSLSDLDKKKFLSFCKSCLRCSFTGASVCWSAEVVQAVATPSGRVCETPCDVPVVPSLIPSPPALLTSFPASVGLSPFAF